MYGTHISDVTKAIKNGKICVIILDLDAANQISASGLDCTYTFIVPPELEEHRRRLMKQGHSAA
jgi:guanylate kinase